MCKLLGLVANKPVDFEFSLERFKELSTDNPDGWGIGWYENSSSKVFKQGISAKDRDSQLPQLSKYVRSKSIIAHVRKGTGASPSKENSHPFQYKNWIFAHNGSIDREYLLPLLKDKYKNELKGETDSEVYFYWILQNVEERGNIIVGIKDALSEVVRREYSGLNFLLSNGEILYALRYSSHSKSYYFLYKLEREPSGCEPLDFFSQETKAFIHSKSLKREKAVLVCSEKLTGEDWIEIGFGSILEISSHLKTNEVQIL